MGRMLDVGLLRMFSSVLSPRGDNGMLNGSIRAELGEKLKTEGGLGSVGSQENA